MRNYINAETPNDETKLMRCYASCALKLKQNLFLDN